MTARAQPGTHPAPAHAEVVFVSMPWTVTQAPSIQLGILKALLDREMIATATAHLYLTFFDRVSARMGGRRISLETYESFGESFGEWAFSLPPFREVRPEGDRAFRELHGRQHSPGLIDLAFRVRALVPEFLDRSADELLAKRPRVIGFSSTFQQTVPSLVLAKLLKARDPSLQVVFGGANCEGEMGEGLMRAFPWIDVIVRGEGERVVPRLFRELLAGEAATPQPNLCVRVGSEVQVYGETVDGAPRSPGLIATRSLTKRLAPPAAPSVTAEDGVPPVPIDEVPLPVYDDYFQRLATSPLAEQRDKVWLPYESARGCWWAVKHICTFCAANAQFLSFRSKRPETVEGEVRELARRYGIPRVWFVDNIMEEAYLDTLFPSLGRDQGATDDLAMFVETRAHVSRAQLTIMRAAGVVMIQLGLESFSSPILKLMDKGTTALQNVRVLKWCAELGIQCFYNVIYGFPGEGPDEYQKMADLIPSISHLEAPNPPVRLRLDRFSPYHRDPARHGIEVIGPRPTRHLVYDLSEEELRRIEYFFTFRYQDGRDPDSYVGSFVEACRTWRQGWRQNFGKLCYHEHTGGLRIIDLRTATPDVVYELGPVEGRLYLACDAGATAGALWSALSADERVGHEPADLAGLLDHLVARRLMFREGHRYLALAVSGARVAGASAFEAAEGVTVETVRLAARYRTAAAAPTLTAMDDGSELPAE